jgi:hypothetical protein
MSGNSLGGAALLFLLSASSSCGGSPQRMQMARAAIVAWPDAAAQVAMAACDATGEMSTRPLASTRYVEEPR